MRGGALPRLGAALALLSPVAGAAWLGAAWSRHRLAQPARVRETLAELGIAGGDLTVERLGHGNMNAVLLVQIAGERVVLKHMLRFGTLLGWGGRELGTMREHPRPIDRTARLTRELATARALTAAGIRVPRVLGASSRLHALALEWIDGPDLASELPRRPALAAELGRLLARMHAHGIAMGDANPRNLAVTRDGLVPFDLETSHPGASPRQMGFDLAWAAAFLPPSRRADFAAAYGPRSRVLDDEVAAARIHLERFWPLVDLFAARWSAGA